MSNKQTPDLRGWHNLAGREPIFVIIGKICYNLYTSCLPAGIKNKNKFTVKVFETKIYLRFLSWFIAVAFLPLASLFILIYFFDPQLFQSLFSEARDTVLFAIFVSLSIVLLLSLVATKLLSRSITKPIKVSVDELSKVVAELFKTIQDLSEISQNSSELSQSLLDNSHIQQVGLKKGSQAILEINQSLKEVAEQTKATATKSRSVDKLAVDGDSKSKEALESLSMVKQLLTENQKLSHALNQYARDVQDISSRVVALADTAKFISLNVSIEANKSSISSDFSDLVSQIRELNVVSEHAAEAIATLASSMRKQIEQVSDSSNYQWQETSKTIKIISQTINFLGKINNNATQISKNVQVIDQKTQENKADSDEISEMIKKLNQQAKALAGNVDVITQSINRQLAVTRSLNRSSAALNSVTTTLNDLVGEE